MAGSVIVRNLRSLKITITGLLALSVFILVALPSPVHLSIKTTASSGSWTEYHKDDGHTGNDASLGQTLTSASTGWTSATLDGEVFAEPLIFGGVVYAATLQNTVYAIRQSDGVTLWSKNVGAPQTSGWSCGNISRSGILGTPVIDTAANRIYVVAEVTSPSTAYHLFGLDLAASGNIVMNTTIAPAGFDWTIQQERGALALHGGYVYIPFGGRWGDCGAYNGWVVAVPTNGSALPSPYKTADVGSGLWGAGGVVVDDATGSVFGATGNGVAGGCSTAGQNDAVVRLSPTLALQDYFMPNDWQNHWCSTDEDLGSAGPVLINSNLLFQSGKYGGGFLLNPNSLGGVDGQLFPTPKPAAYSQAEVCFGNHHDATFGSFAYAAPYVYAECEGHGLVALNLNTSTPSFTTCATACGAPGWSAGGSATFGPPIVAGGAVWVANDNGLYAFNATTGAAMYQSAAFGVNRFTTPAEAGGQVFVPSHTVIRSFNMSFVPWTFLDGVIQGNPVVASYGTNDLELFIRGSDNGLWHRSWNGVSWTGWQSLGGVLSADPSVVALSPTRLDVLIRGEEGGLWHRWWNGTVWSTWESLGGVLNGAPSAVGVGGTGISVIIRGSDNGIWQRSWNGATWVAWQSLGGYATASPAVGSPNASRIDVFHRGTDNGIWQRTWNGSTWGAWQSLGGVLPTDPMAVVETGIRIDLIARGTDNGIWQNTWNGSTWSTWMPRGGVMTFAPAASSCSASHFDVFHIGTDAGIWQVGFNGTTWGSFQTLGGQWTSAPAAICPAGSTSYYLFARGVSGAVWEVGLPAT